MRQLLGSDMEKKALTTPKMSKYVDEGKSEIKHKTD